MKINRINKTPPYIPFEKIKSMSINEIKIMFDKLCAKEGMKRCEPFIKIEESEEE